MKIEYKIIKDNIERYSIVRGDDSLVCSDIGNKATAELILDELNELLGAVNKVHLKEGKRFTTVEKGCFNRWWVYYDGEYLRTSTVVSLLNDLTDELEK